MTYRVVYSAKAKRDMAGLTAQRRQAVLQAERGPLAQRPLQVGKEFEGSGPGALRRLALADAGVSIGYRVYTDRVEVELVWLLGWP
ncbi:hypothetical protein OG711_38615 (plasmid) [Streptomyces uncialis]|uniref:hypothetical protein n=1 Tax=Streptomyces uncialis TaxID=1048205 RepID=UPI002E2EFDB9|nr:hypothetical protein [Streptomyces uncialis]